MGIDSPRPHNLHPIDTHPQPNDLEAEIDAMWSAVIDSMWLELVTP
jgi:hypothetical protein